MGTVHGLTTEVRLQLCVVLLRFLWDTTFPEEARHEIPMERLVRIIGQPEEQPHE